VTEELAELYRIQKQLSSSLEVINELIKRKEFETKPKSNYFNFVQWFADQYKQKFGRPYVIGNIPRACKEVKELIDLFGENELKNLVNRYFTKGDQYSDKVGYNLVTFRMSLNSMNSQRKQEPKDIMSELFNATKP
jgi:hypothetical protein